MLISVTLQNWMSFYDEVSLSMIASKERQHGHRLLRVPKYQMRALPISAIYGGNASGKTNFFKALIFAKNFVVDGPRLGMPIPVQPFKLSEDAKHEPVRFDFEVLVDEMHYRFKFAATSSEVVEEQLTQITSYSERVLYSRNHADFQFADALAGDQFLQFAARGTQPNQLFLSNAVSQNILTFKPVYDWFNESLVLITPNSRFGPIVKLFEEGHSLSEGINKAIQNLDTGVVKIDAQQIAYEELLQMFDIPSHVKNLKDGEALHIRQNSGKAALVTRDNGELIAHLLVSYHHADSGGFEKFELDQESDGTQRVVDLLPAFIDLSMHGSTRRSRVYVIDELDRSLHTVMSRELLEAYLETCGPETRNQLIFTTHDLLLMDQDLLRRDEMWVTERNINGSTDLFSLSEYKEIRYDKDIRKSYLEGRLGGVPKVHVNLSS